MGNIFNKKRVTKVSPIDIGKKMSIDSYQSNITVDSYQSNITVDSYQTNIIVNITRRQSIINIYPAATDNDNYYITDDERDEDTFSSRENKLEDNSSLDRLPQLVNTSPIYSDMDVELLNETYESIEAILLSE